MTPTGVRASGRNGLSASGVCVLCAGGLATRAPPTHPPPPFVPIRRRDPPLCESQVDLVGNVNIQSLLHTRCQTHTATIICVIYYNINITVHGYYIGRLLHTHRHIK